MSEGGFLFVNFDASSAVSAPETGALDAFLRRHGLQSRSTWVTGQTIEGVFNWKMGREYYLDSHSTCLLEYKSNPSNLSSPIRRFPQRY